MVKIKNKIAVLGLDNVGKTSLIRNMFYQEKKNINPPRTQGIEVSEVLLESHNKSFPIMFIDVGGLKVFQVTLWEELVTSDITAIIYMVDVQSEDRIDSDLNAFKIVIKNTIAPILVLGNKFDVTDDQEYIQANTNHLFSILDIIEHKINDPFRDIIVLPISVKTGLNLDLITEWLIKILSRNKR
jgi:small GTP-binding protein